MSLHDAIRISNVPVYQELARRIGLDRMSENLALLDYGNEDTGTIVDMFWLQGPLKISALEQAKFLARLAQERLVERRFGADYERVFGVLEMCRACRRLGRAAVRHGKWAARGSACSAEPEAATVCP